MAYGDRTSSGSHMTEDTGREIDGVTGNDTFRGTEPASPLATIGAAFAAVGAGDTIVIKAGTYTEVGLTLATAAVIVQPETAWPPTSGSSMRAWPHLAPSTSMLAGRP